jgi:hypothetical protein
VIWTEPDRYYAQATNAYWDQGDIVVAPVTALDAKSEDAAPVGEAVRRAFWWDERRGCYTTGETSLGLAMVVSHGCSLDKQFNRRVAQLRGQGLRIDAAVTLAESDDSLDRWVTVAPVIPLTEAIAGDPATLRANKVIGFFPVCASEQRNIDEGVVDLSRCAAIDREVMIDRLGILTDDARATLRYALARYWAYRAPKLTYEIEEAIGKRVLDVEIVPEGDLGLIFTFTDGSTLRMLQAPEEPGDGGVQRPGLSTSSD